MGNTNTKVKPIQQDNIKKTTIGNLNTALLEFQKLNVSATKDSKNPHFKSNYASLEAVIQATSQANQFGICFTQDIDFDAESSMVFVRTTLIHAPSGETRTSRTPIRSKDPADPQKMGSGITYAKRYGLQSMLGLPSEDDDGNEASKAQTKIINQAVANTAMSNPNDY